MKSKAKEKCVLNICEYAVENVMIWFCICVVSIWRLYVWPWNVRRPLDMSFVLQKWFKIISRTHNVNSKNTLNIAKRIFCWSIFSNKKVPFFDLVSIKLRFFFSTQECVCVLTISVQFVSRRVGSQWGKLFFWHFPIKNTNKCIDVVTFCFGVNVRNTPIFGDSFSRAIYIHLFVKSLPLSHQSLHVISTLFSCTQSLSLILRYIDKSVQRNNKKQWNFD